MEAIIFNYGMVGLQICSLQFFFFVGFVVVASDEKKEKGKGGNSAEEVEISLVFGCCKLLYNFFKTKRLLVCRVLERSTKAARKIQRGSRERTVGWRFILSCICKRQKEMRGN